jgi:hypothetical protein
MHGGSVIGALRSATGVSMNRSLLSLVLLPLLGLGAGCSEYSITPESEDAGAGDDDTLPGIDADVDDTAAGDTGGEDVDTDPNNEEPPPAKAPVYAHTGDELFEMLEPASGQRTLLGRFTEGGVPVEDSFIDIAIDLEGRMYGATFTALYQINPTTAAVTKVCPVDIDMVALTFSSDGELFAGGSDGVHIINVNNCRTTPLTVGGGYETSGDLVGLPDGYLYWTVRGGSRDELVRVDPLSGVTRWIGPINFSKIYGLGYDDGVLYGFNDFGDIIAISPDNAGAVALSTDGAVSWYGATTNPVQW